MNLFVAAAGAGVLSFPYFFREAGVILAPILFLFMAVNAAWINALFVFFADRALDKLCTRPGLPESSRRRRQAARDLSFERMIYIMLGPLAHFLAILSVLVACCGALTAYLVLVRDQFLASLQVLCVSPDWKGAICATIDQPAFPIFLFGLLIAFPLSCFSRLSSLGWASALSSASLALSALCICLEAGLTTRSTPTPGTGSLTWAGSPWQVLTVLPIAAFSLGNQFQVLPSWSEHRQEWSRKARQQAGEGGRRRTGQGHHGLLDEQRAAASPYRPFYLPLSLSTAAAYLLYSVVGGIGYSAYGAHTQGDILLNLGQGSLTLTARLSMVLHLALAYPVQLYPARVCLEMLCGAAWRGCGLGSSRQADGQKQAGDSRGADTSCLPTLRSLATSLALVLGTCGLASLGQGVQDVFSLVGGLVAIVLFALPGCLLWGEAGRLHAQAGIGVEGKGELLLPPMHEQQEQQAEGDRGRDRERGSTEDSAGVGIAEAGGQQEVVVVAIDGGGQVQAGSGRSSTSSRARVSPPPEPRPLPSSPLALRCAAAWLFLCAGGIGGLGAGLSIAQVAGLR